MKSKILLILVATLFVGCVVPRTYSRAKEKVDRIVNKYPEILQNDTTIVKVDTTIVTDSARIDTVFRLTKNDTVYIEKEKLKVRFIRGKRDSIYLTAECEPDTVRVNVIKKVPVYKLEKKHLKDWSFLGLGAFTWILILIILILGFIIYLKTRK